MQPTQIKIAIVVLLIIVGVGYLITRDTGIKAITAENTAEVLSEKSTADITPANDGELPSTELAQVTEAGTYQNYEPLLVANSKAEHIILNFSATWCPSCRALDKDILANKDAIPAGVEIYKVDYDTAIELKKQYGVTTQHSLVEIAADGTAKSNITHPATLTDVLKTI